MILPQKLPAPTIPWFEPSTGKPTKEFYQYMRDVDTATRLLISATFGLTVAQLPASSASLAGITQYVKNGRKNGEGAGLGTGVLAFNDGVAWRAVDTGATVAA